MQFLQIFIKNKYDRGEVSGRGWVNERMKKQIFNLFNNGILYFFYNIIFLINTVFIEERMNYYNYNMFLYKISIYFLIIYFDLVNHIIFILLLKLLYVF